MVSSQVLTKQKIRQQQLVQLVFTYTRKLDQITPILEQLHWLPVSQRTDIKILVFVYKTPTGVGPKYILDIIPYEASKPLRSSGTGLLCVLRSKHNEAEFSCYAPHLEQTSWIPGLLKLSAHLIVLHCLLLSFECIFAFTKSMFMSMIIMSI